MNKTNTAIKVEGLSKCYRIGLKDNIHDSFAKSMLSFLKSPVKNYLTYRSLYKFDDVAIDGNSSDIIWAVRDVSFEVKQGEIVGIIGVNGAGKSTLLKMLSRITDPTSGRAEIHGKVSSLLEVGTGFHPELTGRENVYLNGTILGMRKVELDRKFDEIVDFSGVENFIDTPVKRYSSGMKVRLAFAVAAHLEPEILLIDEVLAVGDAQFQKKCLNKMEDVSQQGRTVLFVSHNMPTVTRLCPRTILLNGGGLQADGPSDKIISIYMDSEKGTRAEREWPDIMEAPGDDVVRLRAVRVRNGQGTVTESMDINNPITLEMEYDVLKPGNVFVAYFHVINEAGIEAFTIFDTDPAWENKPKDAGRYVSTALIPENLLSQGILYIGPSIRTMNPKVRRLRVNEAIAFHAVDVIDEKSGMKDYSGKFHAGVVRPFLKWNTEYNPVKQ